MGENSHNYRIIDWAFIKVDVTINIKNAKVALNKSSFVYNGKVQKPAIKTVKGQKLKAGTDYTFVIKNSKGKKSFKKKFKINEKTGKITVKKKLKRGTYKVKVKVKAAGTANYKASTRTVTFKIRVK